MASKRPASPSRYVALLRGINVGGITIRMADLARAFEDLGLTEVRTVLASGNVCFTTTDPDIDALKARIEAALTEAFGYEAYVLLVEIGAVARAITSFPFDDDASMQPWVMFVASPAVTADVLSGANGLDPSVERVQPGDGVIYWTVVKGQSTKSAFAKHTAKARFKATTTTRNLRTLRKILA
ncbi:MAG: hypothetical protein AMXMBFR23_10570 [Chloroflexota bacterium]